MVLSKSVLDVTFRGHSVPSETVKIYYTKDGCFPTSYSLEALGRSGKRRSTPLYNCWCNMVQRCKYGSQQQIRIRSYKGSVNEFVDYQDFAEFCYILPNFTKFDSNGLPFEIDKDIKGYLLGLPNTYSKHTICCVPKDINCFLTCVQFHNESEERSTSGVIQKSGNNFLLRVQDVCGDRKRKVVSKHKSYSEAYQALCEIKKEQAIFLAEKYKGDLEDIVVKFLYDFDLNSWTNWCVSKKQRYK